MYNRESSKAKLSSQKLINEKLQENYMEIIIFLPKHATIKMKRIPFKIMTF
jgi:hypothetical protein